MRVIDLLNKIANGENLPKQIKYRGHVYIYYDGDGKYWNGDFNEFSCFGRAYNLDNKSILNEEVEIIEDKKIEKLDAFNIKKFYDDYPETAQFILAMFNKQEELIDKVNGEDNE